ncbi:MAG: XRE family transcriptional regulator [Verrucomicrobia bacterium]|nr:XRE family transcriptional regulator [Verrucomicrobiota bacterium]
MTRKELTTDNIFDDLGLKDDQEMLLRSDLMSEVVHIIRKSGLPQKEIASMLHISQPKVSALMSGKIHDFSTDTLMHYLTLLGCNIEIRLQPKQQLRSSSKRGLMTIRRRPSGARRCRKKTA